ncbi:unnamed protein product [Caenorhabditis bovis]|uniref:Uncharacterized protein n=1 Tax=Caenorhabditis bovis TaxID=2654633 RepID=A0A8S1F141_9PELO|nr:unnamed protein product [Caenorhabditis bovis]
MHLHRLIAFLAAILASAIATNCYACAPVNGKIDTTCPCAQMQLFGFITWDFDGHFSQARNNSCLGQMVCNGAKRMMVVSHVRSGNSYDYYRYHRWTYKEATCQDYWIDFAIRCDRSTKHYMITRIPVNKVIYEGVGNIPRFKLPLRLTYLMCQD